MKKLVIFFIGASFLLGWAGAPAEKEDFGKLESIHEVKFSKEKIFDKIMIFIATKYNSPKTVMEYNDKNQGIITWNGVVEWYQPGNYMYAYYLNYKMTIHIKQKKYKIELTPLRWEFNGRTYDNIVKMLAPEYGKEFDKIDNLLINFIKGSQSSENDF